MADDCALAALFDFPAEEKWTDAETASTVCNEEQEPAYSECGESVDLEFDGSIDEDYVASLIFLVIKTCSLCRHSSNELNPITRSGRNLV